MFRMLLVMVGMATLLGAQPLLAQEAYPSKAVRIIVPWPPGGPPDLMARLAAPKMTELWGKPVIVENRAGATGTIGTDLVAKAAPDGYTILLTPSQPLALAPALFKTPYDPLRDIVPVALVAEDVNLLVVSPSSGIRSVAELVAAAKSNPGKLTFSSSGVGSIGFMCGELMKQVAGIDMLHVPYQGAAQAIAATLSGEVSLNFPPVQQGAPQVKAGKLLALGVTGTRPSRFLPEVPPLSSQGLGELVVANWYGVFVPPKTPRPTVQAVRDAFQKVVQDPGVRQKLDGAGMEPLWQESDQALLIMEADLAKWRRVVQTGKIRME
jgi:tripartite-type tricarboxylate transporter receptor subunit TctC